MTFEELVREIEKHDSENPTHGVSCACMDQLIRRVRIETKADPAKAQQRVDYVLRAATNR